MKHKYNNQEENTNVVCKLLSLSWSHTMQFSGTTVFHVPKPDPSFKLGHMYPLLLVVLQNDI